MTDIGYTTIQFWKEALLATAIIFIFKYYCDRWRTFMLGSKVPGPVSWPIVGNALEFLKPDLDVLGLINGFNKKYGFFRIYLGSELHTIVCTPEDAEIFCTSTALLDRTDHFKFFKAILGNGLLTASGPEWKKAKDLMEPAFKYSSIKSYFPIVQKKSDILIESLKKESAKSTFSFHRCITNCSFDIIVESTIGIPLNAQDGNVEILEHVEEVMAGMWNRTYSAWQQIEFLYRLSAIGKDFYRREALIKNYVDQQIISVKKKDFEDKQKVKEQPNAEGSKDKVFIRKLLDDEQWSDDEIRQHVTTMIALGFETSSSAVSFIIMMLGMHQDVQEKAYQEVSSMLNTDFDDADVMKLNYLDRVVKETLRLFPIAPITFRKAKEDIQFTKYLIPKGSAAGINIFAIQRDPRHYENPDAFDPDNFLPENVAKRHPYSYIPFLMGRRKCIAGKFAMVSMKIIVAKILLNFKIECHLKLKDLELRDHITLKTKNSYYPIRLIPR